MCSAAIEALTEPEVFRMQDGTETIYRCRVCGDPYVPKRITAFMACGKPECRRLIRGEIVCEACGRVVPRVAPGQRTCGELRCRDRLRVRSVEYRLKVRQRCRDWAAARRNVKSANPWLCGAPIYAERLPGGVATIRVDPRPRWPMEHRNVRALHGMLSTLIGEQHDQDPAFAILPVKSRFGWSVYFWEDGTAARLCEREHEAVLFDRKCTVEFGICWPQRAPRVSKRGHRRLRIDAITPVCSQSTGRSEIRVCPTTEHVVAALTMNLPRRLRIPDWDLRRLKLEMISHETQPGTILIGGKYGVVRGWVGSVVVETNAVGEWLLRCCQIVGLGGRTAFGMGRIEVHDG